MRPMFGIDNDRIWRREFDLYWTNFFRHLWYIKAFGMTGAIIGSAKAWNLSILTNPMPQPNLSSFWTNLNEALKIKLIAAGPIPRSQIGGLDASTKLYRYKPERESTVKPGRHQKAKAITPEIAPPWVEAVEITSWVELGPGSPWPVDIKEQ